MTYRVGTGDPEWTFDYVEMEKQVAVFAKAQGKVTQAQWDAFVTGISTLPQAIAVCKGVLSVVKCNVP